MASHRAAVSFRRLFSYTASATSPRLLGHFHHPGKTRDLYGMLYPTRSEPGVRFEPHTASSPRLSLDFLPGDAALGFSLVDSHLGLLLLFKDTGLGFPGFLVCDPVSRRHVVLPAMPPGAVAAGGALTGAALLSRAGSHLEFEAICTTVHGDRLRAWVASVRDSVCSWRALPRSSEVTIDFNRILLEQRCVHAAGSLYFHICGNDSALALDVATRKFSFLRAPTMIWDDLVPPKYRIGETQGGSLCVGALEHDRLLLCVQGRGSHDGWVLQKEICLRNVLDAVPGMPEHPRGRGRTWLSDMDAGRTGRVFIRTLGCGRFSYHLDTGKLDRLTTDDGMEYGDPIFAYFSAPDGGSR